MVMFKTSSIWSMIPQTDNLAGWIRVGWLCLGSFTGMWLAARSPGGCWPNGASIYACPTRLLLPRRPACTCSPGDGNSPLNIESAQRHSSANSSVHWSPGNYVYLLLNNAKKTRQFRMKDQKTPFGERNCVAIFVSCLTLRMFSVSKYYITCQSNFWPSFVSVSRQRVFNILYLDKLDYLI